MLEYKDVAFSTKILETLRVKLHRRIFEGDFVIEFAGDEGALGSTSEPQKSIKDRIIWIGKIGFYELQLARFVDL